MHKTNVVTELNVNNVISWVLGDNVYVIENEDYIYAQYSFYRFEQDMLVKYKDDNRIEMVSGDNLHQ